MEAKDRVYQALCRMAKSDCQITAAALAKVTLQQIGNDDLSLFERSDDVATVAYWYQDSAEGFDRAFPDRRARLPR